MLKFMPHKVLSRLLPENLLKVHQSMSWVHRQHQMHFLPRGVLENLPQPNIEPKPIGLAWRLRASMCWRTIYGLSYNEVLKMPIALSELLNAGRYVHNLCSWVLSFRGEMFGPVPWRVFQQPDQIKMRAMHIKLRAVPQLDTLYIMPNGFLPHNRQYLHISMPCRILPRVNPQTVPPLQPKLLHMQVQYHLFNLHLWIQLPWIRLLVWTKMPTVLLPAHPIACQFICLLKVSIAMLRLCKWNLLSQLLRCLLVQRRLHDCLSLRVLCQSHCTHLSPVWSCQVSLVQKFPNSMHQV
jgi:hypothetical protein